jgi:hypothetical protein
MSESCCRDLWEVEWRNLYCSEFRRLHCILYEWLNPFPCFKVCVMLAWDRLDIVWSSVVKRAAAALYFRVWTGVINFCIRNVDTLWSNQKWPSVSMKGGVFLWRPERILASEDTLLYWVGYTGVLDKWLCDSNLIWRFYGCTIFRSSGHCMRHLQ